MMVTVSRGPSRPATVSRGPTAKGWVGAGTTPYVPRSRAMAVGSWVRRAVGTSSAVWRARAAATVDAPEPPRAPIRVTVVVMELSFVVVGRTGSGDLGAEVGGGGESQAAD